MEKNITGKKFASNVVISIAVQIVSLMVNFILQLIVPKFIDEYQYAYWQTYVLYVGYVGVLHFGLLDGLVLRYSQYDYNELDKERIRSQFKALLGFNGFLTLLVSMISLVFCKDVTKIVVVLVAIGITAKNVFTYSSYSFQITNRINKYAVLVIVQRLIYGLMVVVLLLAGVDDFYWYCIADLLGDCVSAVLASFFNKGMYFGKSIPFKDALKELKCNVSSGIILMLANWSAILLISSAKMIIQWRWNELTFGKVSFAFSLTSLFLTFVSAISVVLFPSLKRLEQDKLPEIYKNIRNILSPILLFAMLFYFPGCWILKLWLPKYANSLTYLGILLPMIIYSSKVNLLTNNYLKAYRKERAMLFINLFSTGLGVIAFLLCAYAFNSLTALLVCIVFTVMLSSILSEIVVLKVIKVRIVKEFIVEAFAVVGFIVVARVLPLWVAFLAYLGIFTVYCIIEYRSILDIFQKLKRREKE